MPFKDVTYVTELLDLTPFDLQPEVVCSALRAMKENPNLTISEAFWIGWDEWIK